MYFSGLPLSISLEENLRLHDMGAEIFTPFVVERFATGQNVHSVKLTVTLTDANAQEHIKEVQLNWLPKQDKFKPLVAQERIITEWGALGVACAILPPLLGLRVLSVALEGERFDYRIGNESGEWGLEVSGTISESADVMRDRHRLKVRQLRENPARLNGYVVIVGFTLHEVLISFQRPFLEKTP